MNKTSAIKVSTLLALTLAMVALMSVGFVWAGPMGRGGCWGAGANLTPEQASQVFDLKQKFANDTAELRKQMMIKRTELAALWRSGTPEQNQLQAKQQEINALRDQLQSKRTAFQLEVQKICPQAGMGMGRGAGRGMGRGMAMGARGGW